MASVTKEKTKDGVIFYQIVVSRGRGKSRVCRRWYPQSTWSAKTVSKELNKYIAKLETDVAAGKEVSRIDKKEIDEQSRAAAAKIITLKQYGEKVFMPSLSVRCAEHTRDSYTSYLKNHIYPVIGDIKLPDVTSAEITSLLLAIQADGKSHATVIRGYAILSSLFKMAYLADEIEINPMGKVERPKPRKDEQKKGIEAFSADEIKYILQCVDNEPLKWQVYIRLLSDTGIRRCEGCALTWRNVDFKENTITIAASLGYTKGKGIYMDTPKNGRTRTIDVSPDIMELMKKLRTEQAEKHLSEYVFTQEGSKEPMHPDTPTEFFRKFGERYGIDSFHPHKLRHTFASLAITNGADIASVSEILGHSDKAITLRVYSHADSESRKRASQIFRDAVYNVKAENQA